MFGLGPMELLIVLFLVLFFFGGKKLPQIGEGLGKGIREFKKSIRSPAVATHRKDLETDLPVEIMKTESRNPPSSKT